MRLPLRNIHVINDQPMKHTPIPLHDLLISTYYIFLILNISMGPRHPIQSCFITRSMRSFSLLPIPLFVPIHRHQIAITIINQMAKNFIVIVVKPW